MKHTFTLALAFTAATFSLSVQADIITAQFAGNVQAQSGTTLALNAPVNGQFSYDTVTSRFLNFTIGGFQPAAGFDSSADITPDQYSARYEAQLSPQFGNSINTTFTLDLEGINRWPGFNAVALLTNAGVLSSNLDVAASSFGFYMGNGDGTSIRSMTAGLSSLAVTAVPEPGSWALMLAGMAAVGVCARRRKA